LLTSDGGEEQVLPTSETMKEEVPTQRTKKNKIKKGKSRYPVGLGKKKTQDQRQTSHNTKKPVTRSEEAYKVSEQIASVKISNKQCIVGNHDKDAA